MRKQYIAQFVLLMLFIGGSGKSFGSSNDSEIRVMSFNIRNSYARDDQNKWDLRKELVYQVIQQNAPDVLGLQEANRAQMDELMNQFPKYGEIGIGSQGGTKGQYSAILYRKEKYRVGESGDFWLSETPDKPSKSWSSAHVRICTWAKLIDQSTQQSLYVYNTHMDDGSKKARENGIQSIVKHLHGKAGSDQFVLMGDFNTPEDSPVISYLKGTGALGDKSPVPAVDAFRALHPDRANVGTYNGFSGDSSGPKIDYIFVAPSFRVLEAAILTNHQNGRYPSDHFPVTARLRFK